MKRLFPLLYLLLATPAWAEFAQVHDPDGFANLRTEAGTQSRVIRALPEGSIVYLSPEEMNEPPKNGWHFVQYRDRNGKLLEGWLHGSRLKKIAAYPAMQRTFNGANFVCRNQEAELEVKMAPFAYAKHRAAFGSRPLAGTTTTEQTYYGQSTFGTDATIPTTAYTSISVVQQGRRSVIDPALYRHLFNPYFLDDSAASLSNRHTCTYDAAQQRIFYQGYNSDGAATYEVLFVFEHGKATVYAYSAVS